MVAAASASSPEPQPPSFHMKGAESSPKAVHEPLEPQLAKLSLKTPMQVDCFDVPCETEELPFDGTSLRPFDPNVPLANFSPGALPPTRDSAGTHAGRHVPHLAAPGHMHCTRS